MILIHHHSSEWRRLGCGLVRGLDDASSWSANESQSKGLAANFGLGDLADEGGKRQRLPEAK